MNTRKKKFYRILSVYLLLNLVSQICWPTAAFALTNGPGQPEFQSFEPAGTTEMVNLFTGDFNYNIPLMTVPGPNGGYPINLAYHAGISVEQEASWVGLGWNINAGAINRSMRGLPDDFSGEKVKRELHFKPNTNFSFSLGKDFPDNKITSEKTGFTKFKYCLGLNISLYYNNYRGIGFGYDVGISHIKSCYGSSPFCVPLSLNLSANSDGIGVNVGMGPKDDFEKGWFPKAGLSWGSNEGIKSISLGGGYQGKRGGYPFGAGISFAKSGFVPTASPEMTGFISMLGVSLGLNTNFDWDALKGTSLDATLSRSRVKNTEEFPTAFGYLYAHQSQATDNEKVLEDLNIEKDVPPSRESKTIGIPVATYDIYSVSGQGAGGSFRPYRSDIGIYTEPKITSIIRGGKANLEIGPTNVGEASTTFSWGANGSYVESQTYSGMWYNHFFKGNNGNQGWNSLNDYVFHSSGLDYLYEPFYFKMSGEQTAAPYDQLSFIRGESAVRFKLNELFEEEDNGIAVRPEISSDGLYVGFSDSETPLNLNNSKTVRTQREKRVVSNQSYTNAELSAFTTTEPANIYNINEFPATGLYTPIAYDYSSNAAKQIGAFTEVNPDGNRYVYGIPVHSTEKEVAFAFQGIIKYDTAYSKKTYSADDASTKNDQTGTDQYYSSTTLPRYASTYLLTVIYSPDYVDLTNDGPTDDDMGYFVKFNYVKTNGAYKWRAPYFGAIQNTGFLSNPNDDKLSYQYGEKEIYMLHSIETKTHIACFVLQNADRLDGHEAIDELGIPPTPIGAAVTAADGLRALDSISLYSKADPAYGTPNALPIKSVHFIYNNTLCPKVANNGDTYATVPGSDCGKLTLTSFYFTYRGNTKGQLHPYAFDYIDMGYDAGLRNPGYNPLGNDRWGTYKVQKSMSTTYRNNENPYVDQKGIKRKEVNESAAAWCLKKITLPSGSTISIKYEADDYAYVQDKSATEMCRIVGTLKSSQNSITEISNYIDKDHTRICFELDTTYDALASVSEVGKYFDGMSEIYFKIFVKLKKPFAFPFGSDYEEDYVTGYCKLAPSSFGFVEETAGPRHYGYFTIKLVDRDDYLNGSGGIKLHPFRKAAYQYIYLDRPDLFTETDVNSEPTGTNLALAATNMITEIPRAVLPYPYATARGWAKELDVDNSTLECEIRPSYVRLTTPDGIKAGGGHRVASIIMTDEWEDLSGSNGKNAKYGISYSYRLANGKSSGVAAYEPMIGGDEIALRKPIRYNSDNLVKNDAAFYVEEPMGESFFPAPVVGYSRVVVQSIVGNNNKDENNDMILRSRTGKTVYEFYTARDFPVRCSRTDLQKTWFPIPVFLPFIGSITYNNRGFSQGYSVVLNDMHGKLKSVSSYSTKDNLAGSPIPVRRVEYKYHTDASGRMLRSDVEVLTADGQKETAKLGETYDFYNDLRQHSNQTLEVGVQVNINMTTTTGIALPVFLPLINISKSLYRSAATMKVIYRTGILMEVKTIDDGATSIARNLLFDAETGAPLLTTVTNEFEKPVYTYNYAAHWSYDGMHGAYKNVGTKYISISTNGGGILTGITNARSIFFPGDEVLFIPIGGPPGQMLFVTSVGGTTVTLIKSDGSAASNLTGTFIIARSGHRNQQSISNGVIVSLSDPTQNREFPLFTSLNALTDLEEATTYRFDDCATGTEVSYTVDIDEDAHTITFRTETGCEVYIILPLTFELTNIDQFDNCDFTKNGNLVTIDFPSGPDIIATWEDLNQCYNECIDNVLHASATRFVDEWTMNFADVGVSPASTNDFLLGEKGVWRTESNYLYQVDRKQSAVTGAITDISKDGTYKNFVLYNWLANPDKNKRWSYVSRISQYSPYGYALESSDALGIYSATMFGYANTKQVASASNCKYFELGFDGFEDYGGTYPLVDGHGHLLFTAVGVGDAPRASADYAHTGKNSLAVEYNNNVQFISAIDGTYSPSQKYFEPQPGKKYNLSFWARAITGGTPAVVITDGLGTWTYTPDLSKSAIEGWHRFDISFTAPAPTGTLTIALVCQTSGTAYFDDIRVQPFTSAMVSNVYDPQTHWLLATLDNRNFATFYNYDEEGSVVQVKQETEKGIFTIKTARSNIQH